MKSKYTLEEYMNMPHKITIIPDTEEGGYCGYYPELPGCITCADTLQELENMLLDCKRIWLQDAIECGKDIFVPIEEEYSGQLRLRMPNSLHKRLAEHAKEEQISLNQYCIYLLSRADALAYPSTELK